MHDLITIGWRERLSLPDLGLNLKAKIDTGARTSALHVAWLQEFTRELVRGLVNVHADAAELHEIVSSAVPEGALGFKNALHHTFGRVLSCADQKRYSLDETERMLFVLPGMVESLVHGAVHQARALSCDIARSEAIRTVLVYVNSF